jgi:hypothetical protein
LDHVVWLHGGPGKEVVATAVNSAFARRSQSTDAANEAALRVAGESLLIHILPVRSNLTHENQYDEEDQDNTDGTDATVTESVTVAAEAAAEATKQENNEDDNEDGSERHGLSPVAGLN